MSVFWALHRAARGYVLAVTLLGVALAAAVLVSSPPSLDATLLGFVALGAGSGLLRVRLPHSGTLSLGYAFVLTALLVQGLGASIVTALVSSLLVAAAPRGRALSPLHRIGFNVGLVTLCAAGAGTAYLLAGGGVGTVDPVGDLAPLLAYTAVFALGNLGLIAAADALAGRTSALGSLRANLSWSIPAYVAGTSLAVLLAVIVRFEGLLLLPLAAPFVWLLHTAYRARVAREDEERRHATQTAALYRSVTEALALAIEAKDESTEEHLRRVQRHALELGRRVGLPAGDMEALEAASLLHDIGKIAVPEHILSKPGRLTPEETARMRVHPRVGADILGTVPFPYPLAPIVRHHHERWDGNGYPDGLEGEAIPVGARILAVVDCFDALTADRPYRKALAREEAVAYLRRESGRMFDPGLVELFVAALPDLEREVPSASASTGPAPTRPLSPLPAPLPFPERRAPKDSTTPPASVPAADDPLVAWAGVLARVVPYATLVVYARAPGGARLTACMAAGLGADRLQGFSMALGERVAGWAALQRRPYLGAAHVAPLERDGSRWDFEDFASDPELGLLRSSAVVPLLLDDDLLGVVAVYHIAVRPYRQEDLERLASLAPGLAAALGASATRGWPAPVSG